MNKSLMVIIGIALVIVACKKAPISNGNSSSTGNTNSGGNNNQNGGNTTAIFKGSAGVYCLGQSPNTAVDPLAYSNPGIVGVVLKINWDQLETSPGNFDWTFFDTELIKCKANNKKASIEVLGYPAWVITSLGASSYNYVDNNPAHSTYLQTLQGVVSFDNIYLSRIANLINNLSNKYANDTTVAYLNLISGQISRNLPDTIVSNGIKKAFWTQYKYNADTVVSKMKPLLDLYMTKFPNTPLWNSVDYVTFETTASGKAVNYLASQYVTYGVGKYPDRFGCYREDIGACTPLDPPPSGNQWYIMSQNSIRTGGQMIWNVQDGPNFRQNKCGIMPNTKQAVLDSAVNHGLKYGMRYLEIYSVDVTDATLSTSMVNYTKLLRTKVK